MTHRNSPLTPAGRLRLGQRVEDDGRPIAHVAAEAGVARSTLTKWVHRYREDGVEALEDRPSAPARRPSRIPIGVIELIDAWRRDRKWSARRIALELAGRGHHFCVRTIGRWLQRLGISRRRDLDPTGENNRETGKIIARFPGHMLHLDVKKVGKIPDGGGWRLHGRGHAKARKQRVGHPSPRTCRQRHDLIHLDEIPVGTSRRGSRFAHSALGCPVAQIESMRQGSLTHSFS